MSGYCLIVIKDDKVIEQIPADHKTDKKLLKETKQRYKDQNCTFKFGNYVTEEQFLEVKKLLESISKEHPGLLDITDKNRPEFRHLGYEINKKYKKGNQ